MWLNIYKLVNTSKRAISFRKKCESKQDDLVKNIEKAVNCVFRATRKYYSINKGKLDVRDFYKSRKGRDKEFQKFWKTSENKQRKTFEKTLDKIKAVVLED